MSCRRLLVHVCSCVFCYDPPTLLKLKLSIMSRELTNFLSGSFAVKEDPEPSERVSEDVQHSVGMAEDRDPSHLLALCACPSGTSAAFTRCLAKSSRSHLLQNKDRAFHVLPGFSIHILLAAWESLGATVQLNSDGFTMHKHLILFQYVIQRWEKKDRLHIRKHL